MPLCPIRSEARSRGERVLDLIARDHYDRNGQFIDRGGRSSRGNDHFA